VSNTSYLTIGMIENNPDLLNQTQQEYYTNRTGRDIAAKLYMRNANDVRAWTAGAINTVAFPSLPSISINWTNMMIDATTQNIAQYLVPNLDATILAGYNAQNFCLWNS
jgi:choline dehydrogenase